MNASDLKKLLSSGPIAIEFEDGIEELENYPESGMRAHLMDVSIRHDDVAVLKVNYAAFDAHNQALETANYWAPGDGGATLTAREAGHYTVDDEHYVSASDDLKSLLSLISNEKTQLINEFLSSGKDNYVQWLEEQLLVMRGQA